MVELKKRSSQTTIHIKDDEAIIPARKQDLSIEKQQSTDHEEKNTNHYWKYISAFITTMMLVGSGLYFIFREQNNLPNILNNENNPPLPRGGNDDGDIGGGGHGLGGVRKHPDISNSEKHVILSAADKKFPVVLKHFQDRIDAVKRKENEDIEQNWLKITIDDRATVILYIDKNHSDVFMNDLSFKQATIFPSSLTELTEPISLIVLNYTDTNLIVY